MTTLTPEEIATLEDAIGRWRQTDGSFPKDLWRKIPMGLLGHIPVLLAMAKQLIEHESPAWDSNERLNATIEDQIERAETAEAERDRYREMAVRLAEELRDSLRHAPDLPTLKRKTKILERPDIAALLKTET